MTDPATPHSFAELAPAGASAAILERYERSVMNTFGPPQKVFVRGEGCYVFDAEGEKHLDLLSGIAVNSLGHAHPYVLSAITSQLSTLGHVSNFFTTPAQVALAERLTALTGADNAKAFFTNSGTEANEAAFKITRATGRTKIISTVGGFHGRTMGALAITHNPKYRAPFEPLPGDVQFVPYGDADALACAINEADSVGGVAAVVVEPIQGENGIIVPPEGYLARVRELCDASGALMWVDEVQTGMGRTGAWLAHRAGPNAPVADIVTLAKGLGNGFPIGACLATGRAADLLSPGMHGTTFGGNPVAAIAGLAVMSVIERDDLLQHVTTTGANLRAAITELGHELIVDVRGVGFMIGIELSQHIAPAVVAAAMRAKFVINAPKPNVLRLAPPLISTADQLQTFVEALPGLLAQSKEQP